MGCGLFPQPILGCKEHWKNRVQTTIPKPPAEAGQAVPGFQPIFSIP